MAVNCYSCGFFAKHVLGSGVPTPNFFETIQEERMNGKVFTHTVDALKAPTPSFPVCFRNEQQAEEAFKIFQDAHMRDRNTVIALINADRECVSWYPYTPGFDPKEHLLDLRMHQLELDRQKFQKQMADDQNALMLKLDAEQKKINSKNRLFQWVLFGVAFAEVIVGLLQVLYPTGWPLLQGFLGITPSSQPIPLMPGF